MATTPEDFDETSPARDLTRAIQAIAATRRYLLSIQREDGHWCGELEGDTILESEYILTLHFLGRTGERRVAKLAEYLRRAQLPQGGWAIYPGGPPEVSASVKAYFALKLVGDSPDEPHMARARAVIRELGGIDACNSFTRIYLSIFGQYEWSGCPAVPPELVLLPDWAPFHIYRMSSWSRAIMVPLSIIWAYRPSCPVPAGSGIEELRIPRRPAPRRGFQFRAKERFWRVAFGAIDRTLKTFETVDWRPFRRQGLKQAEAWILERLEKSDGLGAIFPPIINTILALRCLGYSADHPAVAGQAAELEKLELEEDDTIRVQPCFSSVWDTALAMVALQESGSPADDRGLRRAASWLLDREVRSLGDWKRKLPDTEPGGWYFEYANEFYPDADDTAEVLTALAGVRFDDAHEEARRQGAIERGAAWQLAMQNSDGGWAAFDRECTDEVLTYIPFADHNAMIDPSCEDITGRTLEALEKLGFTAADPAVERAVRFLDFKQEEDGTWYGRWGCNYIYGTWLAIRGLKSAGEDLSLEKRQRAVSWLHRHQNEDGGWGELPRSYEDPRQKGVGPSTPSQTAWALMTLLALGDARSSRVSRGVRYLLGTQLYDGSWQDQYWTGTGFPKVFYLRYHLYATYFPLWALSLWARQTAGAIEESDREAGEAPVRTRRRSFEVSE